MKLSILLAVLSAAVASSRTVGVPDSRDAELGLIIADGQEPPSGAKIPGQNPFNLCKGDRSHDAATITQVDLFPNPPVRGKDLRVEASGTVNEAVLQGAVLDVQVKILATVVYHKRFDVCKELGKLGQDCPVAPSNIFVNETFPIRKKGIPHGTYSLHAFARFPNGNPIGCIDGKIKLQ